jgi:hypothetical protein
VIKSSKIADVGNSKTPAPLPSANIGNGDPPSPPKTCRRLKWMVPKLKELHFWNGVNLFESDGNLCYLCGINDDAFDYLVINISPEIEKLSFGYGGFDDQHIKTLVSRCTKLKELRLLAYTNIRNDSITHIIDHLKLTLEKLLIDDAGNGENDFRKLYELKSMQKLKILDFTYNTNDVNVISELRNELPDVSVNGYPPLTSEEENKKI